jgi:hypothetical protein
VTDDVLTSLSLKIIIFYVLVFSPFEGEKNKGKHEQTMVVKLLAFHSAARARCFIQE